MKKLAFTPLLLLLVACNTNTAHSTPERKSEPVAVADNKATGLWIDVRSADEHQAGHLANAVNIPHHHIAQQIATIAPNKDTPIHVYCRSGRRSELALQTLQSLGYTNVTNRGAYKDLVRQGLK